MRFRRGTKEVEVVQVDQDRWAPRFLRSGYLWWRTHERPSEEEVASMLRAMGYEEIADPIDEAGR